MRGARDDVRPLAVLVLTEPAQAGVSKDEAGRRPSSFFLAPLFPRAEIV